MTVLENVLREFKFSLPSTPIQSLRLDPAALDDPRAHLDALTREHAEAQRGLLREEVTRFAARFTETAGLELAFTEDAIESLVDQSLATGKTVRGLCEEKFRDYEFGLQLIRKNTGRTRFEITRHTVENALDEITRWVRESYTAPPP
jgi:hypothetical protein